MATLSITFFNGFHNSPDMTIRARVEHGVAEISEGQYKRLQRHFCGIASCGCGGARRANVSLPDGWRMGSVSPGPIAWSDAALERIRQTVEEHGIAA